MNDLDRRAYFAGLAMQSLIAAEIAARSALRSADNQSISKSAWDLADAMVKEYGARPKSAQGKPDSSRASD